MRVVLLVAASLALGCPAPDTPSGPPSGTHGGTTAPPDLRGAPDAGSPKPDAGVVADAGPEPPDGGAGDAGAADAAIGAARVGELLFLGSLPAAAASCLAGGPREEQVRCLLSLRFSSDAKAGALAASIFAESGSVVGLEQGHVMDGGWRGDITLVPEPPIGKHRRHLDWILAAHRDFGAFFDGLAKHAAGALAYRHRPIEYRFFRSVRRTTPSAYAKGWSVAYNVSGSLHTSADAVRETLFHEIYHLNDSHHRGWSQKALTAIFDDIVARCSKQTRHPSTPCLRPYAPNDTMVRGGTFYAFQPGNGVWEYAAELAIRYYREHRALLAGKRLARAPFKCGPPENAKAWRLLVDEFFAGVDLVPACTM